MDGEMTLGMLVAFLYLMNNFMGPVNKLVSVGSMLQTTEGDMGRIDDVLNYETSSEFKTKEKDTDTTKSPAKEDDTNVDMVAEKLIGHLEIKNLSFGYSKVMPALIEDFSLKVKPGSRVALVGGSGSGKSTIARLVAGLYDPWEGDILFDGVSKRDIPRHVINESLAVIDQDVLIFNGTIKENISFWDDRVSEGQVIQSAHDAEIQWC